MTKRPYSLPTRLFHRIGRRGAALLFFFILDFFNGWSLLDPLPESRQSHGTQWLASVLPLEAWGAIWLFVGLLCLIGALIRTDVVAWVAAMSIKVMWGLLWLLGWMLDGVERGWVFAAFWLALAALVALLAGWAEPGDHGRRPMWIRQPKQR